jgi:hypothetical protein
MAGIRIRRTMGARSLLLTGALLLAACSPKAEQAANPAPQASPTLEIQESGITIALDPNKDPDPLKAALDKRSDTDHCRWQNLTSTERKVHMKSGWPFMEKEEVITIPAFGISEWYSLDRAKASKDYSYEVTPPLFDGAAGGKPVIGVSD